jgi:hypothetical protein
VAESISERLVRLPFYFNLSAAEQGRVIEAVLSFRPERSSGIRNLQQSLAEQVASRETIPL